MAGGTRGPQGARRRRAAHCRSARATVLGALLAVALAGCGGSAEPKAGAAAGAADTAGPGAAARTPLPAEGRERSQAFIEAGNEAYKAADYELALKRYAAAAVADPRDPAAYFGMGMTFTRLKREDEARAAFARAQQLSRDAGGP